MDIAVYGDVHIHTAETKKEISVHTIRTSDAVTLAKRRVKLRDKRCQCCGEVDKTLEINHIFPIAKFPALAAEESNLITLCQSCHRLYHDKYQGLEGADTFSKYMRDYGDEL